LVYEVERKGEVLIVLGNPTNISNINNNDNMWMEYNKTNMKGLRWASLGYHFQWGPRIYEEHKHSPYPKELSGNAII
jgi:hypothetical protein